MSEPNSEIMPVDGSVGMTTAELREAVAEETERRKIMIDYVKSQLVAGVDYGKIHIAKNCSSQYKCTNAHHFSKDNLFKPGMEKILSLMKLKSTLERDEETVSMLKDTGWNKPTVAYKCVLAQNGMVMGEGRGAAEVGEGGKNVNSTVKIAEKRARMDATLSLGFSEFFTQDLEDTPISNTSDNVNTQTGEITTSPQPTRLASPKQRGLIRTLMIEKAGVKTKADGAHTLGALGSDKTEVDQLSMDEAKPIIEYLLGHPATEVQDMITQYIVKNAAPADLDELIDEAVDNVTQESEDD